MERKIGEVFTCNGKTYKVVKEAKCENCDINGLCITTANTAGPCFKGCRSDKTNVVFKEIKDMEIKNNQLTIDIPEGMEIDLKNSDLAKGIIKFKSKNLTYEDILQAYATDFGGLRVPTHCIDKILAISQLMNIAKYYNGDWKPDWYSYASKFSISFNHTSRKYRVDSSDSMTSGNVLFKKSEDAQAVIDNPNFRDILEAIYKN